MLLGALVAAGSLADHGHTIVPGVVLGAAAAVLGFARRARPVRPRAPPARRRGGRPRCPSTPRAWRWPAPALSILFPPLALLVVGALAWLLLGGRRREGEKYAGLRILR